MLHFLWHVAQDGIGLWHNDTRRKSLLPSTYSRRFPSLITEQKIEKSLYMVERLYRNKISHLYVKGND